MGGGEVLWRWPGRSRLPNPATIGRLVAAWILLAMGLGAPAAACGRETDCSLGTARYRVSPPVGWDGRSPLPVALYFHGFQQTAGEVMTDAPLVEAFSRTGSLLVAVDGRERTWTYPGAPSQARDDVAVALAVIEDVARRFPVDRGLVWASGFSQGASMAWWLACAVGDRLVAIAAFAGAFWEPLPDRCPGGPVAILHIHGLSDATVPMAGRALRGGLFRQGDVMRGLAIWRETNQCGAAAAAAAPAADELDCRAWSGCRTGRRIELCLHPGGHDLDPRWIARAWAFAKAAGGRQAVQGTAPTAAGDGNEKGARTE
jgi:polyhydroxybutyrate depolymerase